MKNLEKGVFLAVIVFFIAVNAVTAQHVASPTEPAEDAKKASSEKKKKELEEGYGKVAPQPSKVIVPTIAPLPEYRSPAFDFVPERVRVKEREI